MIGRKKKKNERSLSKVIEVKTEGQVWDLVNREKRKRKVNETIEIKE